MSDLDKFGLFEDADVEKLTSPPKFDIHEEIVNDQPLAAAAAAGPDGIPLLAEMPSLACNPAAAAAA